MLLILYVLYYLCNEEEDDNDSIIPIYIPLGQLDNYFPDKEDSLVKSIYEYIKREYKIVDSKFLDLVDKGKVTFILDALDEMSATIEKEIITKNINNIKKLAYKGNKVMRTSRYTYLSLIQILDFDPKQIEAFIEKKSQNDTSFEKDRVSEIITKNTEYNQLIKKPLFLQIICTNYKDIEKLSIVNPSTMFETLTNQWIIHDVDKKRNLSNEEKDKLRKTRQRLSESLALYANKKIGNKPLSINEIQQQIEEEFALEKGAKIPTKKIYEYYKDAKDSTFLVKQQSEQNEEDTFTFIYKSVMEYFVARRIVNYINKGEKKLILKYSKEVYSDETLAFIAYITDIEWAIKPHACQELEAKIKNHHLLILQKRVIIILNVKKQMN